MKYLIVLVAYFAFASAIDSEKSEERTITSFIQSTGHSLSENLNICIFARYIGIKSHATLKARMVC